MSQRRLVVSTAALTLRDLIGGVIAGIGLGAAFDAVSKPLPVAVRHTLAGLLAVGVLLFAGRQWGRDMARLVGPTDRDVQGRATALAFGLTVILVGSLLAAVEPVLVERAARMGIGIHVVYTMLFVPATILITAIGVAGLGRELRSRAVGGRSAVF